jgi:type I restriction enzyme S subunit
MGIKEVPLSDLLSEVIDNRGKTCPTADIGIPLIATNCIRNEFLYPTYDTVRFVSQYTYSTWFRGHPIPGDIIFVNKATPGRVCFVPDPVDFCIAQDMVALRANPERIYPRYLFAALRSPIVQERIAQMHVGTLIPHFKKGDFDKLLIPVPSREDQRFLGDVYFNLSAKIDLNRRMNETLEAMARAIFKSWFVDFDPVRAKLRGEQPAGLAPHIAALFPDALVETEMGEAPEGWRVGSLKDISFLNPETWNKATRPAIINYVDLSNTKWGRIEATTEYLEQDAPSRAQRVLRPGDTIVGVVRPGNGSYAIIHEDGLTGSTGFAHVRPRQTDFTEFVYLSATAKDNIAALAHLADGAAYPAVRPEVIAATQSIIPEPRVFAAFSLLTKPMLAKMAKNEMESRTLAALRDTLLPKLISGELRVVDAEKIIGRAI